MQATWIILYPVFLLVKPGTSVTNAGQNKRALHGGSQ